MISDTETQTPTPTFQASSHTEKPGRGGIASLHDWLGGIVYLLSLSGTILLGVEEARLYAGVLLVAAAILAVILWGRRQWPSAFSATIHPIITSRTRLWCRVAIAGSALLLLSADIYQAANQSEFFGPAGWLWLACIGLLLGGTFLWSHKMRAAVEEEVDESHSSPMPKPVSVATVLPVRLVRSGTQIIDTPISTVQTKETWVRWERVVFLLIVLSALALRVWNLRDYPNNVYPDEILTGSFATQSFVGDKPASIFSTVWGGIDLPALWFWIVSIFLKMGGSLLEALRLPAALFGAATVIPLYFLLRDTWGRAAAITGAAIMAFSASNIHYSRLALNNIVTQFFWVTCFLFLLRGLRSRRPLDWTLAGLFAGLSEHFYYGTRLLPFILATFFVYLLVVHWRKAKQYAGYFALTAFGYLVGFGPLLSYFITHPNLYFGRGVQMMVWNHIPTSFDDFGRMVSTLWPIITENLLGISTHSSQDIIYFGTLLMVPEAALLVLGVGLLIWKWRHPAAFLMLLSGVGVLFVGGSLLFYPNSGPPFLNHWTPAFPFFYCALAIPVGLWAAHRETTILSNRNGLTWVKPAIVATGLTSLAWLNVSYYFGSYHADASSLKTEPYRQAQGYYDLQVAESRYVASLGAHFAVIVVGKSPVPYDADLTRYLLGSQADVINVPAPEKGIPTGSTKDMAFIFFPGNEQSQALVRTDYPGGKEGTVIGQSGSLAFYTYTVLRTASEGSAAR